MKAILYLLAVVLLSHVSYGMSSYEEYDEGASDESNPDKDIVTSSYVLPKQIFNDGKPFYLEKDPVSGILDFNSKKSSGLSNAPTIISPQTDKDISLNTNNIHTPNFHDFLNLPVKYSSSKFVYPLVSSSYANLKYQGNNKNFISNHKNYSTTTTTSPKYYTVPTKYYTTETPKTTPPLHPEIDSTSATKSTIPPTRPQPVTTVATTISTTTTTTPTTTEITQATTTPKPLFTREPTKYTTTKYRYSTIRKRPLTTTTVSVKEVHSTTPATAFSPRVTPSSTAFTSPSSTLTYNIIQRPTTTHTQFRPLPTLATTTSSYIPYSTRSPGDVYNTMTNKKDPNDMSLSELFNSLLDDEMPESSNSQQYDSFSESSLEIETRKPILQNGSFVGVSEENIGNEYVKYEVQKPNVNVAQYKPVSTMNNIVISPDQDSASFVLGSQQSVGSHYLGSDAKEPISNQAVTNDFKYGTYYNENNYQAMKPQGFVMTRTTEKTTTVETEPETAKPANSGIRFPVDKFDNAPIVTGTFKSDFVAPIALPQTGSGHIVFPPNSETVQTTVNAQHMAASNSDFLDSTNLVSFQENKDKPNHIQPENVNSNQVISLHQVQKNQQQQQQQQGPHTLQFTQQQEFVQAPLHHQQGFVQSPPPPQQPQPQQPQPQQPQPQQIQQYESPLQQQFIQPPLQFNQQQAPPQFVQLQNSHAPFVHPQQQANEPIRPQNLQLNHHPDQSLQPNYPTISNDLTPPEESNNHPQQQFSDVNHRPPITRPPQHFGHNNDLTRNPLPGVHRPISNDRPLPNILPQFRPNAKVGQGHPHNKEPSNMRMGQPPFGARLPQTQQRLQHNNPNGRPNPPFRRPPSPANAFNSKMAGPPQLPTPEQMDQNRRYFQLRPSPNERVYNFPPRHYIDGVQRHGGIDIAESKSDTQAPIYENNEFQRNIPRRSVGQMSERTEERGKLEPVVTLQMIQYQKLLQKDASKSNTVPQNKNPDAPVSVHTASDKPPVYVVYPVKTSPMKLDSIGEKEADPVVVGQRGEQSPLPPSEINSIGTGNEYQNTPFTVIRQEQEPILMVKQKQGPKQQFPYPLERPENGLEANGQIYFRKDPFYGNNGLYNLGEEPVDAQGRVVNKGAFSLNLNNDEKISSKLTRLTERPIAIAYTPTEPTNYYNHGDKYSLANHAGSVIPEIRDESDDDTDEFGNPSRGENYQKDFQAPFYPSISLGNSPDHRNGWAVLAPTQGSAKKKEIDNRSDTNVEANDGKLDDVNEDTSENMEVNTEAFNSENFQPEFQSGFKPIYPDDMNESPSEAPRVNKLAKEIDSIEALVYDDEDDKEETSTNK